MKKRELLSACALLLATLPPLADAQVYKVRKGDNLYTIAKTLRVSVDELKKANRLATDRLQPGAKLLVPAKEAPPKAARADRPVASRESSPGKPVPETHVVKRGETLGAIAKRYALTVQELQARNGLEDGARIHPGLKLVLAAEPVATEAAADPSPQEAATLPASSAAESGASVHVVQRGETLGSIAKRYALTVEELQARNGLKRRSRIHPGLTLVVAAPAAPAQTAAVESLAAQTRAAPERRTHRVEKGDTVWKIARRFGLDPQVLLRANGLEGKSLRIGQELVLEEVPRESLAPQTEVAECAVPGVPAPAELKAQSRPARARSLRVVVGKGDTLKSLARAYSLSVDELRRLNGLGRRAKLKTGMVLLVGNDGPKSYVVKKGDNLWRIAQKFHVTTEELARLNGIGRHGIRPGQKILLESPAAFAAANPPDAEPTECAVDEVTLDSEIQAEAAAPEAEQLSIKDRVIRVAKKMLDIPYRFGGNSLRGIDCSAYVQKVFRFLNVPLPRTAREQFNHGEEVSRDELASGDLVFFQTYARFPSHVGIYLGNNKFIHASSIGKRVTIDSLETPYYSKRFIGGKRLVREAPDEELLRKATSAESATAG